MEISVIIPTYKNKDIFLKNLKHNLPYLKTCEIIVINDNPTVSLKKDMDQFPHVFLIENTKNDGFGKSINTGVQNATSAYIMLLNNDVQLMDTSYESGLTELKKDPLLFGVGFAQIQKDGTIVGKNRIYWKNGFFQHDKASNLSRGINGWAEGGSCLIDKQKFLKLGGIDPVFSPFYWEDVDLSYRAWKNGYKIIFDPQITVLHNHESTIGKYYDKSNIQKIAFRNQLLFIWTNITDASLLFSHLIKLPIRLVYYGIVRRNNEFISAFFEALSIWREIVKKRKLDKAVLTDKQILSYFHE